MFQSRTTLFVVFLLCGIVALGAGFVLAQWMRAPPAAAAPAPLPPDSIAFPDADGEPRVLTDYPARLYLVNFWATWCAPCREEMPLLMAMAEAFAAEGLQVVGIAIDNVEAVRRFRDELGIDYPLLMAPEQGSALMDRLGNDRGALPYTVFLAADGTVLATRLGILRADELPVLIRSYLP